MERTPPLQFTAAQLEKGQRATIDDYQGAAGIQERLRELGFVRGQELVLSHKTLFGDFVFSLEACDFALRREEAQCLLLK